MRPDIVTADRIVTGECVMRRMIVLRCSALGRGDTFRGRRMMRNTRAAADHGGGRNSLEGKRE
jgi:hypothetical protein